METLSFWLVAFLIFSLGASVGSFLNVVVYRLPANLSLLHPPSRCPHCLHKLGKSENVPILGWLWLRGRCAHCHAPIAVRYPLVEAVTGSLFLLVFLTFGFSVVTPGYWAFFSWLLALALIDLDTMTLPHALTQSGLVMGLVFQGILGLATSHSLGGMITQVMVGVMGAVVGLWTLELIERLGTLALGKAAMGAGDAKLAAMMGAWLGWGYVLLAGFLASLLGTLIGVSAQAMGRLGRGNPMPFGPFLAAGAVLVAFFGKEIIAAYLQWFL